MNDDGFIEVPKGIEAIEIHGHADLIGDEMANEQLARARAESVRDDLAAQGLPAERMTVQGHGEREPIVECKSQRSRLDTIACLAPDRRVEILARGVK